MVGDVQLRKQEGGGHPEFLPLRYPVASEPALHGREKHTGPFTSLQAGAG